MRRDRREELRRALGLENSAYQDAGDFEPMLYQFTQLDKHNSDAVNYDICSVMLLLRLFDIYKGIVVDTQQRCLWALNVGTSQLPKTLPLDITHIRRIQTEHYYWTFSMKGSHARKRVDIRKPRGRLSVLDLVCPVGGRSISSVFRCAPPRALLDKPSSDQNSINQPADIESTRGLETSIGKMEIVDT